jgi:hypothetical protein
VWSAALPHARSHESGEAGNVKGLGVSVAYFSCSVCQDDSARKDDIYDHSSFLLYAQERDAIR